jgi:hypothetical protein
MVRRRRVEAKLLVLPLHHLTLRPSSFAESFVGPL